MDKIMGGWVLREATAIWQSEIAEAMEKSLPHRPIPSGHYKEISGRPLKIEQKDPWPVRNIQDEAPEARQLVALELLVVIVVVVLARGVRHTIPAGTAAFPARGGDPTRNSGELGLPHVAAPADLNWVLEQRHPAGRAAAEGKRTPFSGITLLLPAEGQLQTNAGCESGHGRATDLQEEGDPIAPARSWSRHTSRLTFSSPRPFFSPPVSPCRGLGVSLKNQKNTESPRH